MKMRNIIKYVVHLKELSILKKSAENRIKIDP